MSVRNEPITMCPQLLAYAISHFYLPLINVFEEDTVFEGSTLGALAGGDFEYVVPA
jgi:hypothetical protein